MAEAPDQLMYIAGDYMILLRDLGEILLASCEGVVGWVRKGDVQFESLASTSGALVTDSPSQDEPPRTFLTASAPNQHSLLPLPQTVGGPRAMLSKSISGPFELDSPQNSPGIESENQQFLGKQGKKATPAPKAEISTRASMASVASSDAFGGIGGFMMEEGTSEEGHESLSDGMEDLTGTRSILFESIYLPTFINSDDFSPTTASLETPVDQNSSPSSPIVTSHSSPSGETWMDNSSDAPEHEWNMDKTYVNGSRSSPSARYQAKTHSRTNRVSTSSGEMGMVHAARAAAVDHGGHMSRRKSPPASDLVLTSPDSSSLRPKHPVSPKTPADSDSPITDDTIAGRSVATALRKRIQRDREEALVLARAKAMAMGTLEVEATAPTMAPIEVSTDVEQSADVQASAGMKDSQQPRSDLSDSEDVVKAGTTRGTFLVVRESSILDEQHAAGNPHDDESIQIKDTPRPHSEVVFTLLSSPTTQEALLASPIPLDDGLDLDTLPEMMFPTTLIPAQLPIRSSGLSPNLPVAAYSPKSPSSPHSIAATQQAVEVVRRTPGGRRLRALTLVGRMEADLGAAKGPVPITFTVGGAPSIGLGLPPSMGRGMPEQRRATTPTTLDPPMPDAIGTMRDSPSRFPATTERSGSLSAIVAETPVTVPAGPQPGFFPARPRSRSFSAAVAGALAKSRKDVPHLQIDTSPAPPVPTLNSPQSSMRSFFSRTGQSTPSSPTAPTMSRSSTATSTPLQPQPSAMRMTSSDSAPSLALLSARSSSFTFSSKASKTPRKTSRVLLSPVSHKDFEDTVQADGMDFEIVKPSLDTTADNRSTMVSGSSSGSLRASLPETDEWGFLKEKSPTPEIFQSRNAPGDHRAVEQKWVSVII